MNGVKNEQVKTEWLILAERLLESQPIKLNAFKQLWNSNKLQEAYLYVDTFIRESNIKPSKDFQIADENFYWLLR